MLFLYTISLLGLLFLIINTALFFTNRKVKDKVSKVFLWYLASLTVIEVICHIVGMSETNSNFYVSHFYFFFQFTFLSYFFYTQISSRRIKKIIVLIYIIQFIILSYTYYNEPQLFWRFNTFEIISTSLILIIYTLIFLLRNLEFNHQYFNFLIGLILYLSCSIAIFISGNLDLVLWQKPYIDIWIFNSIFYIVFQYFLFREFVFQKKS